MPSTPRPIPNVLPLRPALPRIMQLQGAGERLFGLDNYGRLFELFQDQTGKCRWELRCDDLPGNDVFRETIQGLADERSGRF